MAMMLSLIANFIAIALAIGLLYYLSRLILSAKKLEERLLRGLALLNGGLLWALGMLPDENRLFILSSEVPMYLLVLIPLCAGTILSAILLGSMRIKGDRELRLSITILSLFLCHFVGIYMLALSGNLTQQWSLLPKIAFGLGMMIHMVFSYDARTRARSRRNAEDEGA